MRSRGKTGSELSSECVRASGKGRRKHHTREDKPAYQQVQLDNNRKKENTDDPMKFLLRELEAVYQSRRISTLIDYQMQSRQPCNLKHKTRTPSGLHV